MDKYLKYQEEQINDFLNSSLAKELFDLVKSNTSFKIQIGKGPIFEKKYKYYCLSISLTDLDDNIIDVFDDGYLTAYVELVSIRKDKVKFSKWDDIDFIDDIKRIIQYLKSQNKNSI